MQHGISEEVLEETSSEWEVETLGSSEGSEEDYPSSSDESSDEEERTEVLGSRTGGHTAVSQSGRCVRRRVDVEPGDSGV